VAGQLGGRVVQGRLPVSAPARAERSAGAGREEVLAGVGSSGGSQSAGLGPAVRWMRVSSSVSGSPWAAASVPVSPAPTTTVSRARHSSWPAILPPLTTYERLRVPVAPKRGLLRVPAASTNARKPPASRRRGPGALLRRIGCITHSMEVIATDRSGTLSGHLGREALQQAPQPVKDRVHAGQFVVLRQEARIAIADRRGARLRPDQHAQG
jgi:hypothetical protein